ncbi:MAG TPA: hypothetical protein VF444_21055 [Pseudonocardiaceae bacterium]
MHPDAQYSSADTLAVARAERAVAALDELDHLPVAEHVARFDAAHAALADALASIDQV